MTHMSNIILLTTKNASLVKIIYEAADDNTIIFLKLFKNSPETPPKNSLFRMISTYHKCFCSGILACIGSVFAKWAFGDISFDDIYNFKIVAIRLISLFCMIYFNTKGLTLFIENLKVRITKNCSCKVGCVFTIVVSLLPNASRAM